MRPEPRPAGASIASAAPIRASSNALDSLREASWGATFGIAGFALAALVIGVLAGISRAWRSASTLGLAFALLAFLNLSAGLVAFTILAFLEFALPGGAASFAKGAGLLLALAWLARIVASRDEETFFGAHPGATYLMLAFLGWGVLSLTWTESTNETLIDLSRYLLNFALLAITFTAVRSREYVIAVIAAWVAGTALTGAYGLIETPTADPTQAVRLESTVGNANVLATILVAGIVLSIAAVVAFKQAPMLRIAAATAAAVALFGLRLHRVAQRGRRPGGRNDHHRAGRGPPLARARSGCLTDPVPGIGDLLLRLRPGGHPRPNSPEVPGQVPDTEGRSTLWQVGWRMVEDQPVRGVGVGNFQSSSINYILEPGHAGAHRPDHRHAEGRPTTSTSTCWPSSA